MIRKPIIVARQFNPTVNEPYGYIYITTNKVNNKKYIGQHFCQSVNKNYIGPGVILKKAIEKYGKNKFISEPIDWAESKEELDQKEIWWIDFLDAVESDNWYNVAVGGEGAGRGKDHPNYGKLGELNPLYGIPRKESTKEKISETLKKCGLFAGENNPNYGKSMSDEQKHLISENSKVNPNYGMKGKHHSEKTKKLISERTYVSDETRQKNRERLLSNNPVKHGAEGSRARRIYAYDYTTGEFLQEFSYIAETQLYGYNVVCVRNCLAGNQKQHKNVLFSYNPPIDEQTNITTRNERR